MAVITPTTTWRESMGSTTLFINKCTAVSSGDTLNCAAPPLMYWALVTSGGAKSLSSSVQALASGSTLTMTFAYDAVNMMIAYNCYA